MKIYLSIVFLIITTNCISQSIVQNSSFDSNLEPTGYFQITKAPGWSSDCGLNFSTLPVSVPLLSETSPFQGTRLPKGYPANPITERTNKPQNQRKITQITTKKKVGNENDNYFGNTVMGTFTSPLEEGKTYQFCYWVWASRNSGHPPQKIQLVLRNNNDCDVKRVVYDSPTAITPNTWINIQGSFNVSSQDVQNNFSRFEIRGYYPSNDPFIGNGIIYVDDVNIMPIEFLGEDVSFCQNSIQPLDAGAIGTNYNWFLLPDITNSISTSQTYTPTQPGIYRVVVSDPEFGCDRSDEIEVTINDNTSCLCDGVPVAQFEFVNSNQTLQMNSLYGLVDVYSLCLSNDLFVDASNSVCETGYFVEVAEVDLMTWTDLLVLHSDWVTPLTQAPNNIDITTFLPQGYQLRPNKVYKFKLAVSGPWHSETLFFTIDCCDD